MFANRFTALLDACVLAGALKRNLLLSLAAADFFRLRWSDRILDEAERAIRAILAGRNDSDAAERAARARNAMQRAFEDAVVIGYEHLSTSLGDLPDPNDSHFIAAAVKTRASVIVTDNLRHFPASILEPLDIEAKTADAFIADTIDLDIGRAVVAVKMMRERFNKPEKNAATLLLDMEAAGLTQTVDSLREHVHSL